MCTRLAVWVPVLLIGIVLGLLGRPLLSGKANATPDELPAHVAASDPVAAGKYLVTVAGCNDCHTPGWMETGGQVDEALWLTGTPVGFRGPWGTTYPSNLRKSLSIMSEDDWVRFAKNWHAKPPMPSFNVNRMSERDLRAVYKYVATLKPVGEMAPTALMPDAEPTTPYFDFVPKNLPVQ